MMTFVNKCALLAIAAGSLSVVSAQDLPAGEGRETLKRVCTACHDIDSIPRLKYTRAEWMSLVYSMKDMGADGSTAEMDSIIDYLTLNFGKDEGPKKAEKTNVNKATASQLEGLGFTAKEAAAIVEYRGKNGSIKDLAGLAKVEGVDNAHVQAAKEKIEF